MAKPKVGQHILPSHGHAGGQSTETDSGHGAALRSLLRTPMHGGFQQALCVTMRNMMRCVLWVQRVSRQSLGCVHNSCWPLPSPPRHSSEPEICRASPGCLFDALFLNNSQIFKQLFYQHYMFRRHPGMSRVPGLAGPLRAQPCSSAELSSGLQLTPAPAQPLAGGAELSAPGQSALVRQAGNAMWLSETPSLARGLLVVAFWGITKSPKTLLKTSISNFCPLISRTSLSRSQIRSRRSWQNPFWLTKLCWFWEKLWASLVWRLTEPVFLSHSSLKTKASWILVLI